MRIEEARRITTGSPVLYMPQCSFANVGIVLSTSVQEDCFCMHGAQWGQLAVALQCGPGLYISTPIS